MLSQLNPNMQGTYMGLVNLTYVGFALGSGLGGSLYDVWGKEYTFLFFAVLSLTISVTFIIGHNLSKLDTKKTKSDTTNYGELKTN
jgi:predicted MFS family arabinose efflux permease